MNKPSAPTAFSGGGGGNNNSTLIVIAATTIATTFLTFTFSSWYHQRKLDASIQEWHAKRAQERTGRIRAEVKLRNVLQNYEVSQPVEVGNNGIDSTAVTTSSSNNGNNINNRNANNHNNKSIFATSDSSPRMTLSCIGRIASPYTKRMGTPRQGMLVPSSRGFVQIDPSVSPETLDGIDQYGHAWILFRFHVNTSLSTERNKTKIRPPRGNGIKVGMLSTRSPHRPNDIGLSLVEVHSWDPKLKRLHIRGLDLVHDTPVYDIKPYVPWDVPPGIYDMDSQLLKVPTWVKRQDDVLPEVTFTDGAYESLQYYVEQRNVLSPLYPVKKKKKKKSIDDAATVAAAKDEPKNDSFEAALETLREILAQDPRSSHKGLTKNQRGTVSASSDYKGGDAKLAMPKIAPTIVSSPNSSSNNDPYRLLFGPLEVDFLVQPEGAQVIKIGMAPKDALGGVGDVE